MTMMDVVGPTWGACVFVVVMSLVREPDRRTLNAVFAAGASGVYLSGGFGVVELLYPLAALPAVYRGLGSYRWIGVAWLMHAAWDLPHHLWGNPIWPFMPASSFGCFVFDTLIAIWFLAGAPDLAALRARGGSHRGNAVGVRLGGGAEDRAGVGIERARKENGPGVSRDSRAVRV